MLTLLFTSITVILAFASSFIISASKPFLSFDNTSISTRYEAFGSSCQYTSIILPSSFSKSLTFTQSLLCTDTPLPFVIYPIMSSPGSGLQHFESLTKQLSIPFTIIPVFEALFDVTFGFDSSSILSCISSSLCSFLYSSNILAIIFDAEIAPNPTLAYISSTEEYLYLSSATCTHSGLNKSAWFIPILFISLSINSFPFTVFSSLSVFLNHCKILFFALVLFTNFSQSRLGPFDVSEVITSTISPLRNFVTIGIILLFILHPTILCPTSACMLYAKSIGVASFGKTLISPFGVNT